MTLNTNNQIKIIAAVDEAGGIGKNGSLPWPKLPKDMARFKAHTDGEIVIMGRKTFLSLGKPLKNRTNVVLSKSHDLMIDNGFVFPKLEDALKWCVGRPVWLIGGADVYREGLEYATDVYLTRVPGRFGCDVFFPFANKSHWRENQEETTSEQDGDLILKFQHYTKK